MIQLISVAIVLFFYQSVNLKDVEPFAFGDKMISFSLLKSILKENCCGLNTSNSVHVNIMFIASPLWYGWEYWTPHTVDKGPRLITSANRGPSHESRSQLGLSQGAAVETVTRMEKRGDLIESKWL